jgi:uncharacterized C2H2 Zn-finger protein
MPNILSTLRALVKEKLSVRHRENELLTTLNRLLPAMGYKVVLIRGNAAAGSAIRSAATPKSLPCPHCDRRFAHPLHLGRHVSATHKNGVRRPQRAIKTGKRSIARSTRKAKKAA